MAVSLAARNTRYATGLVPRKPACPVAATSRELPWLPELPQFTGPGNELLGATRWASPLLVLGAWYTLAIHGQLRLPIIVAVTVLGTLSAVSAQATLVLRRRRLLRAARALRAYAERTVGISHELYRRSSLAVLQLEQDSAVGCDPTLTTDVEQGMGYTRELLQGVQDGREVQARRAAGGARPL